MALLLRKHGVKRIRPLAGGLDGWREAGYALQRAATDSADSQKPLTQIKTRDDASAQ